MVCAVLVGSQHSRPQSQENSAKSMTTSTVSVHLCTQAFMMVAKPSCLCVFSVAEGLRMRRRGHHLSLECSWSLGGSSRQMIPWFHGSKEVTSRGMWTQEASQNKRKLVISGKVQETQITAQGGWKSELICSELEFRSPGNSWSQQRVYFIFISSNMSYIAIKAAMALKDKGFCTKLTDSFVSYFFSGDLGLSCAWNFGILHYLPLFPLMPVNLC